jgi:hypothetical protein
MKKTITLVALMAGAVGAYAQGTIAWGDYVSGFTINVWSPQTGSGSTTVVQGNSSTDQPTGNTVYTGVPIGGAATGSGASAYGNGNNYTIGLYASTGSGVAVSLAGTPVATSLFFTSGGTGLGGQLQSPSDSGGPGNAGGWVYGFGEAGTTSTLPGTGTGTSGSAQVELAAWYSGGGATTYAAAIGAGVPAGYSPVAIFSSLGGVNPNQTVNLSPTLAGSGITSFSLAAGAVPEPSTIALGVIGASAFLMRLRRKQ